MGTNDNSQDTRHVERVEESSAGWKTQHLSSPDQGDVPAASSPSYAGPPAVSYRGRRSTNSLALGLIGLGVLVWRLGIVPDPGLVTGGMVLLTIASCVLFFAFWRRLYPLLIPGSILAGLSVGVPFADLTNGTSVLWGLALGFLAIRLIGRSWFNVRSPWAIFPAVVLFGVGVISAVASLPAFFGLSLVWLPLLLIAAGVYLGRQGRTA